jgi:probable phosphoglycerate mutase
VRHAAHALLDRVLVGRTAVELDGRGRKQAQALARRFEGDAVASVQSSPQLRARETAEPIAQRHALPVEIAPSLDEIDIGAWTGRSFEELQQDAQWQLWNSQRDSARAPGGESMGEAQSRMLTHLQRVHTQYQDASVILVSHGDPIRAALLHYLSRSLNDVHQLCVDPASVTTLLLHAGGAEIVRQNENVCVETCVTA